MASSHTHQVFLANLLLLLSTRTNFIDMVSVLNKMLGYLRKENGLHAVCMPYQLLLPLFTSNLLHLFAIVNKKKESEMVVLVIIYICMCIIIHDLLYLES